MLQAIFLMVLSAHLFGLMVIAIRLASQTVHPFEVAFFRNSFGFVFALPLLWRHGLKVFRTDRLPLYFFRCVIGMISMLAGFWAIAHLPLAQAVSISYSTPLFVTVGAVLVLGEIVRVRRWSAVIVGFVGVLVIIRPGSEGFSLDALVALLAAVMSASVAISIKFLSRTEHADAIVLYTTLLWIPLSLVPAAFVWQWPNPLAWLWVALAGLLGTLAHICWTRALQRADASLLTPISFVQLPIVCVLAYFLFGEIIDRWTAVGAGIIFAANAYIAHRETKLKQEPVS